MKQVMSVFALCVSSIVVFADDELSESSVFIEHNSYQNFSMNCKPELLKVEENDFQVVDYLIMSSKLGQRSALISVQNTSSGQRILTQDHFVGVFANCTSAYPNPFKLTLHGNEQLTYTLHFGYHKYPMIKILSRRE